MCVELIGEFPGAKHGLEKFRKVRARIHKKEEKKKHPIFLR